MKISLLLTLIFGSLLWAFVIAASIGAIQTGYGWVVALALAGVILLRGRVWLRLWRSRHA